jgi:uncharacterized damage-inducible protein DinB
MKKLGLLLVSAAFVASAQTAGNPLSTSTKTLFGMAQSNITRSAEQVPEADYAYKPTPEVRSFGQLVGHVADANYMFCSAALEEKAPVSGVEKTKTTKAELVQALKESFAYCDKAYNGMTDAEGVKEVKFFGREWPKLGILDFNNMHDYEHYGNMVTYMRLKGMVPPSSQPRKK